MGRGYIDTGKLEAVAPRSTVSSKSTSSGWTITLGSAIFSAVVGLSNPLAAMPTIGVTNSETLQYQETYAPSCISADQLVVKVDDALFSGYQLRSKVLELTATGQITVESLRTMFESHGKDSSFSASLLSLANCLKEEPVDRTALLDPRLAAFPSIRFARTDDLEETIDNMAQVVGTERFYAKIAGTLYTRSAEFGLFRDGIIATEDSSENIQEARQRYKEDIKLRSEHKSQVINPGFNEVFGAIADVDEFNKVRAEYANKRFEEGANFDQIVEEETALATLLEEKDVKESYQRLKTAEKNLQVAAEKIEKIEMRENVVQCKAQPEMGEFAATIHHSIEKEKAIQEYNTIARTCLVGLTTFREGAQNWAKSHPKYAKVAEYAMDAVGYGVMITSTIALVSSFTATAAVSVPAAIGGLAVVGAKDYVKKKLIPFSKELVVEYAKNQGETQKEGIKFADTAEWLFAKVENIIKLTHFSKTIKDPIKPYKEAKQSYNIANDLYKNGKIAHLLNASSNIASKERRAKLLSDVLSKMGGE